MSGSLMNLASGIWFSMSNGALLLALAIAFGIGFVAGVFVFGYFGGRHGRRK